MNSNILLNVPPGTPTGQYRGAKTLPAYHRLYTTPCPVCTKPLGGVIIDPHRSDTMPVVAIVLGIHPTPDINPRRGKVIAVAAIVHDGCANPQPAPTGLFDPDPEAERLAAVDALTKAWEAFDNLSDQRHDIPITKVTAWLTAKIDEINGVRHPQ